MLHFKTMSFFTYRGPSEKFGFVLNIYYSLHHLENLSLKNMCIARKTASWNPQWPFGRNLQLESPMAVGRNLPFGILNGYI